MKSDLPKVLHHVAGRPMLGHVFETLKEIGITKVAVVLGENYPQFFSLFDEYPSFNICVQKAQNGTGDAVASAAPSFIGIHAPSFAACELVKGEPFKARYVLICYGDVPALTKDIIRLFVQASLDQRTSLAVLGMDIPNPKGYGRILTCCDCEVVGIVEDKDATPEQKKITICNSGIVFAETEFLFEMLSGLTTNNSQKEYYLTDCFELAKKRGKRAFVHVTRDWQSLSGINDREQLAAVERMMIERSKGKAEK